MMDTVIANIEELLEIKIIQEALILLTIDKYFRDGYVDLATIVHDDIHKDKAYDALDKEGSRYKCLYKEMFPTAKTFKQNMETIGSFVEIWGTYLGDSVKATECSLTEAKYIISYINYLLGKRFMPSIESMQLWKIIYSERIPHILTDYKHDIQIKGETIIYNATNTNVEIVKSIQELLNVLMDVPEKQGIAHFYRGHTLMNYQLIPSIMRKDKDTNTYKLMRSEQRLYNELQYKCADDFKSCKTHLEKLTIMQHYGLPTRLLDITTNPLVALYFACSSERYANRYGEIVVLQTEENRIKWPSSDTVSILASMSALSYEENMAIRKQAMDLCPGFSYRIRLSKDYCEGIRICTDEALKLVVEVGSEKPGFMNKIRAKDLMGIEFVYAMLNNRRINNQNGAFILFGEPFFGLGYKGEDTIIPPNEFRINDKSGKRLVICVRNKKKILDQLDVLGIKEETMFPEIEDVTRALVRKI